MCECVFRERCNCPPDGHLSSCVGGLSAVGEVAGRYGAGCGSGEGGPSGGGQLRELIVSLLGNP